MAPFRVTYSPDLQEISVQEDIVIAAGYVNDGDWVNFFASDNTRIASYASRLIIKIEKTGNNG